MSMIWQRTRSKLVSQISIGKQQFMDTDDDNTVFDVIHAPENFE